MNTDTILRLLSNSGFYNLRADADYIYMEDPACVIRAFETFVEYAWFAIAIFTGLMLFGWAITLIRGAKNDYINNAKNLIILFSMLSLVPALMNLIYGGDIFALGCKTISISIKDAHELLELRHAKLGEDATELYEKLDIYDAGIVAQPVTVTQYETKVAQDSPEIKITTVETVAVSAQEAANKDVIYTMQNGEKFRRVGGTRAWRNSNPGNIRYTDFAKRVGAIGSAGGFAVFPNEEIGLYAIEALLRTNTYSKLTVAGAISKYAPPSENNTSGYQRKIEKMTGISINKPMADLTDDEMQRVVRAIKTIEGWKAGEIKKDI